MTEMLKRGLIESGGGVVVQERKGYKNACKMEGDGSRKQNRKRKEKKKEKKKQEMFKTRLCLSGPQLGGVHVVVEGEGESQGNSQGGDF